MREINWFQKKYLISDTETRTILEDVKEFMALVPTDKVLSIILDYIANDPELHKAIVYIQSEKLPIIHQYVQYLKEYKEVSAFMCMFLKPPYDRKYMFSFYWNLNFSFLVLEVYQ